MKDRGKAAHPEPMFPDVFQGRRDHVRLPSHSLGELCASTLAVD